MAILNSEYSPSIRQGTCILAGLHICNFLQARIEEAKTSNIPTGFSQTEFAVEKKSLPLFFGDRICINDVFF